MNTTELLAYWITEREAMRKLRESEHLPFMKYGYSNDPHMGLVRYCNVRREDDKVTRWLAQHWRPQHHAVWQIVLARMVNYIPTLEEILPVLGNERPALHVKEVMRARRLGGEKLWTSAYTISTCGKSMDKVDYMLGVVDECIGRWGDISDFDQAKGNTLAAAHGALMRVDGLGSFLAAQVVADLKNTKGHRLQNAHDWHMWSAPGPGSLKGLSEYFEKVVTPRTYHNHIHKCWEDVRPLLPPGLQDLHMQDFQNCLCEFSKFMRVRRGGHVRNKYSAG